MEKLPLDMKALIEEKAFKMNYDDVVSNIPTSKIDFSKLEIEWGFGEELVLTFYYQCYSKVNAEEVMEELGGCMCDGSFLLKWSGEDAYNVLKTHSKNLGERLTR